MENEVNRTMAWATENMEDWKIVCGITVAGIKRNQKIFKSLKNAELNVLSNMIAIRIYHMWLEDVKDNIEIV